MTATAATARRFRSVRIGILLLLLFAVALYAWADVRSRAQRNEWHTTLDVAVVLLEEAAVDPRAVALLRARLDALESQLQHERQRYQPGSERPFHFELIGPARVSKEPPAPAGTGPWDLIVYTWELRRYVRTIDDAMGVDASRFDSRVYTTISPPVSDQPTHVEGRSEHGGRIAQVRVELDESMVDLALVVVTHELLHTLGAVDKYDSNGRTLIPVGLADPTRSPQLPQLQVEVMARNRPVEPGKELVPTSLTELGVGPTTAREIGWAR